MRKVSLLILFFTISFGLVNLFAIDNDRLSESRMVVKHFAGKLKGELLETLKNSGLINAISVCSKNAPMIADSISQEKGWKVGRVSLRYRNPGNEPDIWEFTTLMAFMERLVRGEDIASMEHHEILNEGEKQVFRYMKAIPVGKPCLNCHGKQIGPTLKAKLTELYPEDQAIGYSLGEIIGAFSISQPM